MSNKQKSSKPPRNEYQRQQELKEARKAGTAAPEEDVVTGKVLNPHVPDYIAKTPWFYGVEGSTLIHQHNLKEPNKLASAEAAYQKGFVGKATSYRKGACENCGSMTHKKKECFYRPRKQGAKKTNEEIMPDEIIGQELNLGYDGKRDRWVGYDPSEHLKVVEEYEKVDQMRREKKARELMEQLQAQGKSVEDAVAELGDKIQEEEFAEDGTQEMVGQHFDGKTRMTVRNLRIREDTAKYLYNLDSNSAYYDPKSRSMREDPLPDVPADQKPFAGDGFIRSTGDAQELNEVRAFAMNLDGNELAAPSAVELQYKRHQEEKAQREQNKLKSVLDRYGGQEHLLTGEAHQQQKQLLMGQSEMYREFAPDGRQLSGPKHIVRSRYEEDVFEGNHTAVWGSYWEDFKWGYACCHQFVRNSYCTGEQGKRIKEEQDSMQLLRMQGAQAAEQDQAEDSHSPKKAKKKKKKKKKHKKKAAKGKKEKKKRAASDDIVTEQDMEDYQKKRARREDPMNNF